MRRLLAVVLSLLPAVAFGAASDAQPVPIKNTALRVYAPLLDADGDLVTGASGLDSECSCDGGTFADCTNEATEVATSSGIYYLELTTAEANCDAVAIIIKSSSAKTTPIVVYPATSTGEEIPIDARKWAGAATATDDVALITNTGASLTAIPWNAAWDAEVESEVDDSIGGGTGTALTAIPWNASWDTEVQSEVDDGLVAQRLDELLNADSDIDGAAPPTVGSVFHEALTKTTGSFTYDQTTDSGEAIRDRGDAAWITATGFSTLTQADIRTAMGLASANLDMQLSAIDDYVDTEVAAILAASRLASGTSDSGSTTTLVDAARTEADTDYWRWAWVCATSGNIAGQCGVVTAFDAGTDTLTLYPAFTQAWSTQDYQVLPAAPVNLARWLGTAPNALASGRVDSTVGAMQANTMTASALATDAVNEIVDQAWEETLADHSGTSGSTAAALNAAGAAGDPWSTAIPGAYGAGTAGYIVGNNVNATISSRSSHSAADVWTSGTRTLTAIDEDSTTLDLNATYVGGVTVLDEDLTTVDLNATTIGTVTTLTGHTPQTGDSFARLGAPAGASVSADIAAVEAQTDDIGVAGAGLTDLGGMSTTMKAQVQTEADDALRALRLQDLFVTDVDTEGNWTAGSVFADMLEESSDLWRYTTAALANGPSGGGGSTDWSAGEREQIRQALGVTGTASATSGSGNVDTLLSRLTSTRAGYIDNLSGGAVALAASLPTNFSLLGINGSGHLSRVTLADTITTYTGDTPQTGDAFARLGAPSGVNHAADIADIESKVDDLETRIPDADVDTFATRGLGMIEADGPVYRYTENALEQGPSGGAAANPQLLQSTTIATLASQTSFTLSAGSTDDNAYNDAVAVFTDQVTSVQKAQAMVLDYVGATRTITLAASPAFTIAAGDDVDLVAVGCPGCGLIDDIYGRVTQPFTVTPPPALIASKLTLRVGVDYYHADGAAPIFRCTSCPALTGATITLRLKPSNLTVSGTIDDPTGTPRQVHVDIPRTITAQLTPGVSTYDVKVTLLSGNILTPWSGQLVVEAAP